MPVNSTHPSYDEHADAWQRIRDVLAGDSAVKRAGERYVPRLDSQSDDEYRAYVERGFFYNATARTVAGYVGMIFRRDPVLGISMPATSPNRRALEVFVNDVDLLGSTLDSYSKSVVHEIISLGRAGTLVDFESESENRACYPRRRGLGVLRQCVENRLHEVLNSSRSW